MEKDYELEPLEQNLWQKAVAGAVGGSAIVSTILGGYELRETQDIEAAFTVFSKQLPISFLLGMMGVGAYERVKIILERNKVPGRDTLSNFLVSVVSTSITYVIQNPEENPNTETMALIYLCLSFAGFWFYEYIEEIIIRTTSGEIQRKLLSIVGVPEDSLEGRPQATKDPKIS